MSLAFAAALSQSIVPQADLPPQEVDPCASFAEGTRFPLSSGRAFTMEDQVTLADIGRANPLGAARAFDASPDGQRVAFTLKRANPEANAYCQRLMVVPIDGSGPAIEVDRGGEYIRDDFPLRDFPAIMGGWDRPNPPRWSPDGSRIGYLKRLDGSTQVWLVDPDRHRPAQQVTALQDNVDSFTWVREGDALVVATRPGIRLAAEAIAREAAQGFLFDERFSPQFADRPIPTGQVETRYSHVSLVDGKVRAATSEEARLLSGEAPKGIPARARAYVENDKGFAAWLEPSAPDQLISPTRLVMVPPDRTRKVCAQDTCEGIRQLWWASDGSALLAIQATGWANSQTAILRWDIGEAQPHRILLTEDVLVGCTPANGDLLCGREGFAQPRQLVAIDCVSGKSRLVHDPNPALRDHAFGTVERLRFRNAFGAESYADLVLPPDHRAGQRHPLVVVQYTSVGFLRGGTGDEVPIHPLANRGFAVLSFDRPDFAAAALGATTEEELTRANRADWIDRRRVQSSLETAISLAIDTGAVDPARMGISGFSDGGSTVQWALINSDLFRVASMGSCCEDMFSYPLAAGPRFTDFVRAMGYRHFEPGAEEFWKPISLILNVEKVDVPILIQTGDSEYEAGLDVIETYTHRGRPIELYVLENETHIKWQPAHRKAIYRRSVEWFDFWLQGRMDCDPSKARQYARWLAMAGAPARDKLQCSR